MVLDGHKLTQMTRKPFFKNEEELVDEDGEITGWEVESRKRTIQDDKPIHVAAAILQHSKILFLE